MSNSKRIVTNDDCESAVKALEEHGSQRAAAKALGVPRTTFQEWIYKANDRGQRGFPPVPVGQNVIGLSTLIENEDGNKQWVKTRAGKMSIEDMVQAVKDAFDGYDTKAKPVKPPTAIDEDLNTVYIIADWHIGLLAWHKEGVEDMDIPLARAMIEPAMAQLVGSTPKSKQCVILGLGDLLHINGYDSVTPGSKNRLDSDGRYPKILTAACHLVRYTIDLALQKHEHALVRILPGNHDPESSVAVNIGLQMLYENDPRVTVDDNRDRFWWWQWGKVLLGATHGDKAKMADLPLLMAAWNPEAWGQTTFRHVFTGHIHTQTGIEKSGVTVESFQTPISADYWHHSMGYGAQRSITAITHHKEHGEILRNKVNIHEEKAE